MREKIALAVRQLYYGLIGSQMDRNVALEDVRVAEDRAAESEREVRNGAALEVSLTEARTKVLEAKQAELTARIRHADFLAQFDNVLGLPQSAQIDAEEEAAPAALPPEKAECVRMAEAATPEIHAAEETVKKAEAAVRAARLEYVPDVTLFARHDYQDGIAFLYHNYGVVGAEFKYTLFDGGKRRAAIDEREAQRAQALENLRRLKEDADANVERAFDRIEQGRSLIDVARQVVDLRTEADRIAGAQLTRGTILASQRSEAAAALAKAQADLVKADLGYRQSLAELEVAIGRLPR